MSIGENIRRLREERGLSQHQLGEIAGVTDKAVSTWELDNKTPRMGAVEKMSLYFGVPKSRILDEHPDEDLYEKYGILPIKVKKIPLLGTISCGEPIFAAQEYGRYIETNSDINADFCLEAKGDSMINARIHNGDIVFIHSQSTVSNGEIAAVVIDDEVTLKRAYYYPDDQRLVLQSENPDFAPLFYTGSELENVKILGKAVAFQSYVK